MSHIKEPTEREEILLGHFNSLTWNTYVVSKVKELTVQWYSVITHKYGHHIYWCENLKTRNFSLMFSIPNCYNTYKEKYIKVVSHNTAAYLYTIKSYIVRATCFDLYWSSWGPLEIQIQGLCAFFNALWDPKCLQD